MSEDTLALIRRAHQGDKEARDRLFHENTGLIYCAAKRFVGRGVDMEDLFQIGSIGLLKAVDQTEFAEAGPPCGIVEMEEIGVFNAVELHEVAFDVGRQQNVGDAACLIIVGRLFQIFL